MSSAAVLVGLPEHYAHILESSDANYPSTLPPAVSTSTTLRRDPSFTQFPRIDEVPETASAQLTPVQEKAGFTEPDLVSVGGKSSSREDGSSGMSSPEGEPPTPPESAATVTAKALGAAGEEVFPSFFDDFEWGKNFTAADAEFRLTSPMAAAVPSEPVAQTPPEPAKTLGQKLRRRSWMPSSGRATPRNLSPERKPITAAAAAAATAAAAAEHNKALAALEGISATPASKAEMPAKRRNSWMPSSRSRAPSPEPAKSKGLPSNTTSASRQTSGRPPLNGVPQPTTATTPATTAPGTATGSRQRTLPPLNTDVQQKRGRRLSGMFSGSTTPTTPKRSQEEPRSAPPVSLTKSLSGEKLTGLVGTFGSFDKLSTLANTGSFDTSRLVKSSSTRRRDEAWGAFKALDSDFAKFNGKSSTVKATIVRASLMPFMRAYGETSIEKLRAEDLEKRAAILNKWWTALLDMLTEQNNQTLSATDRPLILDAISLIMDRPEWRAPGSPLASVSDHKASERPRSTSTGSSSSSDFIAEAIYHNIRNTFAQNLVAQMSFAIDRMSLKTAPASIVSFCGKTCAFVFFFVPGAARFLISLWKPSQETMRCILDECGVPRHSVMGGVSKRTASRFPAHLQDLRFTSLTATLRSLQKTALPPIGTADFDWYGPWLKKWTGQESDLFYAFVRGYHALAVEFLPPQVKKVERICAPGLLMVHAQLLANLDATIHRNEAAEIARLAAASDITFDDVLADSTSTAAGFSLSPANINRLMAENRLIMLLRDSLSERSSPDPRIRRFSAESFNNILQAAVKKTSLFNQHACYTLCDFLEEAMSIFARYESAHPDEDAVFAWTFWFDVWRKMMQSQNTTTLTRLFSLLYSTWSHITDDEDRKTELCNDFLLDPDVFLTHFNHWCPMVRGYYMRLICWRLARFDPSSSDQSDTDILARLMERLGVVWGYFLYSKCGPDAETPSDLLATPNPPAPGRRLLIIRIDPLANTSGGISLSLDDAAQSPNIGSRARRNSWMDKIGGGEWRPDSADSNASSDASEPDEGPSRRWSLLRTVVTASSRSKSQSPKPDSRQGAGSRSASPVKQDQTSPAAKLLDAPPVRHHVRQRSGSLPAVPRHRTYCFKFSLEYVDRRFQTPASIVLAPPTLPKAAQAHLMTKYNITAMFNDIKPAKPQGATAGVLGYTGRALAEWTTVVSECQNFFERRMREGVPSSKLVETPALGVETFKRPG